MEADELETFDFAMRSAVETFLRGELNDSAWKLATCGVKQGGLGTRSAKRIALAAAVASLIGSRPLVHSMCSDMVLGGLASPGVLEGVFEDRLQRALRRLEAGLPEQKEGSCKRL